MQGNELVKSTVTELVGTAPKMATTLDMTKGKDKAQLLKALNNCDGKLVEMVNTAIQAVGYMVHPVDFTNTETGEVVSGFRTVILGPAGECWECASVTLLSSLKSITWAYGNGPWEPPLTLTPRMRKKGDKQQVYWFDVTEPVPDTPSAKKGK